MALMMGSFSGALLEGGSSVASAKRAAEEVADCHEQLAEILTDPTLVKTLLGVLVAGVAALVIKTFFG